MIMFKFGLRIGVLAKLGTNDLLPNGIIIFREKNNNIIKRQLLKESFELLKCLNNECEIKESQYIFYFFKLEEDEDKRALFYA